MSSVAAARRFARRHATALRLGAIVTLFVGAWCVAWATGALELTTIEHIRATAAAWGPIGPALFLVAFCLLNLIQVPAMALIAAAVVVWGPWTGGVIGWAGAVLASTTTFLLVRWMGGKMLGGVHNPWARRMLAGLQARPIRTIFVLRILLQAAAPLNATLALTPVPLSRYLLATALGLAPPAVVAALLTELFT